MRVACVTLLIAPAGVGTETGEPIEHGWGSAGEPGLHRLLADLVHLGQGQHAREGGDPIGDAQ